MKDKIRLATWLYSMSIFEIKLRCKIARARKQYITTASGEYLQTNNINQWVEAEHIRRIRVILLEHYQVVAPHFGKIALKQIIKGKKAADTMFFSFMLEWMRTESLRKAQMIADTDRSDIQAAITKGISQGEGVAVIAKSIRDVSKLTTFRASVIARTETHNAATFGSVETARNAEQELGLVLLKKWLPTTDNRTRQTHRDMLNYLAIPLDEKFNVGGEMMDRPGDPSADAGEIINCRCALIYEEKP